MSCVLNMNRFIIPNDVILTLSEIYQYIGKNEYFTKTVGNDMNRVIEQTIARDCYFLAKILKIDLSDTRLRLIITKDSIPRTKDEQFLFNLKETLSTCQYKYNDYPLGGVDLINTANFLYQGQNIRFEYLTDKKTSEQSLNTKSKKLDYEEILGEVNNALKNNEYEKIILGINFFVDFYNLKPFTEGNEVTSFIILYIMLLKAQVFSFNYVSLFEFIYRDLDKFMLELKNASFNWEEGFAQTLDFVRFMTNLIKNSYIRTREIISDFEDEQSSNKGSNVEATIYKLPKVFTKDDIRVVHPYISESTINRALNKLKDENIIKPLGKGRSAKWSKI